MYKGNSNNLLLLYDLIPFTYPTKNDSSIYLGLSFAINLNNTKDVTIINEKRSEEGTRSVKDEFSCSIVTCIVEICENRKGN